MPEHPHHVAVLLVGTLDRRLVPALRFLSSLPDTELHALHIAFDPAETRELAESWMDLGATWLPLRICEPADERVTPAIRAAVAAEVDNAGVPVTVVIPELELDRPWQKLLHRRTARRVALALQDMPNVTAVLVPYRRGSARRHQGVAQHVTH